MCYVVDYTFKLYLNDLKTFFSYFILVKYIVPWKKSILVVTVSLLLILHNSVYAS